MPGTTFRQDDRYRTGEREVTFRGRLCSGRERKGEGTKIRRRDLGVGSASLRLLGHRAQGYPRLSGGGCFVVP